jgi:Na+-transporting NADH:ubiquinone oxidoreductase subunit D
VVDELLKAFAPEVSRMLSVFVGLIITNCIVLSRAEVFAMYNRVGASFLDGVGNGLGFSIILILVAATRELLSVGSLFDYQLLPLVADGGWYESNELMLLAPSAFFIIGLVIWAIRSYRQEQAEQPEFSESARQHQEAV